MEEKNLSYKTKKIRLRLEGALVIYPSEIRDERGTFHKILDNTLGTFCEEFYNVSKKGVLRGLHYQPGQAKLVWCFSGRIYDVIVDVRKNSKTYWQYENLILDDKRVLYLPEGFAHGFVALEDSKVLFKTDTPFSEKDYTGIHYADHDLNIKWAEHHIISEKDKRLCHKKGW